jgi:hypothetical protein
VGRITFARRQPPREQPLRIEIHFDLTLLAAVRPGDLRALHGRDVGAHEVHAQIEQLLFTERVAAQRQL